MPTLDIMSTIHFLGPQSTIPRTHPQPNLWLQLNAVAESEFQGGSRR